MRYQLRLLLIMGMIFGTLISGCQNKREDISSSMTRVIPAKIGGETVRQEYRIVLPPGYEPGKASPVLLVFHDAGEDGEKAIKRWENMVADTDYLLVCPTFPQNTQVASQQENERLMSIVQDLKDRHNINIRNFYVVGYGEGARLAQVFSMNYPALVRGAAVLSGDSYAQPNPLGNSVPFLVITGPSDRSMQGEVLERQLASENYNVQLLNLKGESDVYSPKVAKLCLEFFQKWPPLPKESETPEELLIKPSPGEEASPKEEPILKAEPLPGEDEPSPTDTTSPPSTEGNRVRNPA